MPRKKLTTSLFPQNVGIKSGLYIIQCVENSCTYVGESQNVTARLNAHKNQLRRKIHSNFKLQNDFDKWGEKSFLFQKLQFGFGVDRNTRLKFETILLSVLPPEQRYNTYVHWRKRDPEKNSFFNRQHTVETRVLLSEALSGRPSSFLNKKQSNSVKELISKHNSKGGNRKKGVYINEIFYESVSEASQRTKLGRRIIRKYCNSEEARHSSYRWAEPKNDILIVKEDSFITEPSPENLSTESIDFVDKSTFVVSAMTSDVQKLFYSIEKDLEMLFELIKDQEMLLQRAIVNSLQAKLAHFIS